MHNHDWAKPECLALFPIESYFFLSYLFLSVSPYPCLIPPVTPFLCQPCIHLVLTISSHTLTHSVITTYHYIQTIPSRSPSLVLPNISSLCTLCIPQAEYHLQYSSLWSDPIHVSSLTHPNSPPLTLLKARPQCPIYIFPPSTRPDSCNRHRKVSNALPELNRSCLHLGSYIPAVPNWTHLLHQEKAP